MHLVQRFYDEPPIRLPVLWIAPQPQASKVSEVGGVLLWLLREVGFEGVDVVPTTIEATCVTAGAAKRAGCFKLCLASTVPHLNPPVAGEEELLKAFADIRLDIDWFVAKLE